MKNGLPWHIVENAIKNERKWLIIALNFGIREDKEEDFIRSLPGLSKEEILRQISISLVSGKIKAVEFKTHEINQLWTENIKHKNHVPAPFGRFPFKPQNLQFLAGDNLQL